MQSIVAIPYIQYYSHRLGLFSVYFLLEEVFFEEQLWSVEVKCLFLSESQYVTLKQSIVYDEHSI